MRILLMMYILVGSVCFSAHADERRQYGSWTFQMEKDPLTDEQRCGASARSDDGDSVLLVTRAQGRSLFVVAVASPVQATADNKVNVRFRFDDGDPESGIWDTEGASSNVTAPNSKVLIGQIETADRFVARLGVVGNKSVTAVFDISDGRSDAFAAFDKCVAEAAK